MKYLVKTNQNYNFVIKNNEINVLVNTLRTLAGSVSEHDVDGFKMFSASSFTCYLIPISDKTFDEWVNTIGGISTFLNKVEKPTQPKELTLYGLIDKALEKNFIDCAQNDFDRTIAAVQFWTLIAKAKKFPKYNNSLLKLANELFEEFA